MRALAWTTPEFIHGLGPGWACIVSSGTCWVSMARAAASPGGTAEYGAAIVTGWPQGPMTPGTVGS
jgi:hypothetical protein